MKLCLVCAGKKIHEVLLDPGNEGVRDIAGRYVQECQLMSDLRHPNITQFMGVCFLPNCQLPVLLMERLDGSLDDLLETVPNIPLVLKRSMLEDVSRGLLYLHKHTPQIIHRDLTAKNVLLTSSLVAKITDFGNTRIVNLQPGQLARTLSRLPGTLAYMPPEALSANARYGPSLDVFSFGHLALFTLNQIFPGDLFEHNYPDPDNPDRLTGRTEVERRGQYFETLEQTVLGCRQHQPLIQLIKACLHNIPSRRPSTEQVLQSLKEMKAAFEGPYGEFAKMDAVKQVAMVKALRGRDEDVRVKMDELAAKDGEIQQLQQQLEQAHVQIQQKSDLVDRISIELHQRDEELQLKDADYQAMIHQLNLTHQHSLEEKQTFISQQQMQLETLQAEVRATCAQMQQLLSEQSRFNTPQASCQTAKFNEVDVPLRLQWRKGTEMIFGMSFYPQAVVLKGKVYVGGGDSAHQYDLNTVVTVYDPGQDQWSQLAKYDYEYFAMTVVNGKLMLLGGRNQSEMRTTSIVQVWEEERQGWVYYLPNLPIACDAATAVTYEDKWLIVAGGRSHTYESLSVVNILDLNTHRWHSGAQLPNPCRKMTAALIGKTMVLLGGAVGGPGNRSASVVFSVELDQLISQAVSHDSNLNVDESPWRILPNTPVASSTALTLNGALLAVGGGMLDNDTSSTYSSPIYLYKFNSSSNTWSWIEAGYLPVRRVRCACTLLPSGEIFIAGGTIGREPIKDVRIATLQQTYQ